MLKKLTSLTLLIFILFSLSSPIAFATTHTPLPPAPASDFAKEFGYARYTPRLSQKLTTIKNSGLRYKPMPLSNYPSVKVLRPEGFVPSVGADKHRWVFAPFGLTSAEWALQASVGLTYISAVVGSKIGAVGALAPQTILVAGSFATGLSIGNYLNENTTLDEQLTESEMITAGINYLLSLPPSEAVSLDNAVKAGIANGTRYISWQPQTDPQPQEFDASTFLYEFENVAPPQYEWAKTLEDEKSIFTQLYWERMTASVPWTSRPYYQYIGWSNEADANIFLLYDWVAKVEAGTAGWRYANLDIQFIPRTGSTVFADFWVYNRITGEKIHSSYLGLATALKWQWFDNGRGDSQAKHAWFWSLFYQYYTEEPKYLDNGLYITRWNAGLSTWSWPGTLKPETGTEPMKMTDTKFSRDRTITNDDGKTNRVRIPESVKDMVASQPTTKDGWIRTFPKDGATTPPDGQIPGGTGTGTSTGLNFQPLLTAISQKFPFSLPWDLYNGFNSIAISGDPNFTINVGGGPIIPAYSMVVDMSVFSGIMVIIKILELISFDFGLIIITRRLLGGAT